MHLMTVAARLLPRLSLWTQLSRVTLLLEALALLVPSTPRVSSMMLHARTEPVLILRARPRVKLSVAFSGGSVEVSTGATLSDKQLPVASKPPDDPTDDRACEWAPLLLTRPSSVTGVAWSGDRLGSPQGTSLDGDVALSTVVAVVVATLSCPAVSPGDTTTTAWARPVAVPPPPPPPLVTCTAGLL